MVAGFLIYIPNPHFKHHSKDGIPQTRWSCHVRIHNDEVTTHFKISVTNYFEFSNVFRYKTNYKFHSLPLRWAWPYIITRTMLTCRTTGSPEPGISSRYQPTSTYTTKPSPRRRTSHFTSLYGGKLCFTRWTWFYPPSSFHSSASWCSTCRPKPEKKWHWVSAFSCHSLCSSCSYPKFCHRPRSSSRSLPNTCSSHSSWTRSQSWSLWSSSIGTSGKML